MTNSKSHLHEKRNTKYYERLRQVYTAIPGFAIAIMKDRSQTLQSLKQYLEYLMQDPTCNAKLLAYVRTHIEVLERT